MVAHRRIAATSICLASVFAASIASADWQPVDGEPAASQPAGGERVVTEADDGKTVDVRVGQSIRVELTGNEARTGWESPGKLSALAAAGQAFKPAGGAADPAVGLYTFRYRARQPGQVLLRFHYVRPGGPNVGDRLKTLLVRQVTVTVRVAPGPGATSQPAGTKQLEGIYLPPPDVIARLLTGELAMTDEQKRKLAEAYDRIADTWNGLNAKPEVIAARARCRPLYDAWRRRPGDARLKDQWAQSVVALNKLLGGYEPGNEYEKAKKSILTPQQYEKARQPSSGTL